MRAQMTWTDDMARAAVAHRNDGKSATEIANALAREFTVPVTRNAVCGKMARMGVAMPTGPRGPNKPRSVPPTSRASNIRRAPIAEPVEIIPDLPAEQSPDACTIMDLKPESCRWPLGEPGLAMLYCGTPHDAACGPYCARHRLIARGRAIQISPEERKRRVDQARGNYRKRMAAG